MPKAFWLNVLALAAFSAPAIAATWSHGVTTPDLAVWLIALFAVRCAAGSYAARRAQTGFEYWFALAPLLLPEFVACGAIALSFVHVHVASISMLGPAAFFTPAAVVTLQGIRLLATDRRGAGFAMVGATAILPALAAVIAWSNPGPGF